MLFNLEKPQGNNIFELIFSIIGKAKSNDICDNIKKLNQNFHLIKILIFFSFSRISFNKISFNSKLIYI